MAETKGFRMQGATWAKVKTIVNKLPVLGIDRSLEDFVSAILPVIEQCMPDMFHVHTYLVGTPCFQDTLHKRYIMEALQHGIMGDGMLAMIAFGISVKHLAEPLVTAHMRYNGTFILLYVAPDQRHVFTRNGMVEKLLGEACSGFCCFCHNQQTGGVFINAVYQPVAGQCLVGQTGVLL